MQTSVYDQWHHFIAPAVNYYNLSIASALNEVKGRGLCIVVWLQISTQLPQISHCQIATVHSGRILAHASVLSFSENRFSFHS